ncbi:hypothetical protein JMJ77_0005232 [Colletotrichum scovillei]|uniref:Uncharacterized protein n=1 Tax=Colletotrichum scovillei TaxID=1209932 RepID=A0A9P7UHZ0_9PEZI|nr:hypothetical protein JMJ77_0005232 [Colletotrichum scovillei]KAG7076446.1 hypothetical protein JMJ76_0013711 [Colletotrichum scovillei]KAG7083528.1 hypothetical protein JMJ78_0008973 [Colletotrichum scovillei]
MGSGEPAWPRSSRAGEQLGKEDSVAARQVADTVSRIHPICSWTVERRAAPRRPRETLNKIPAAAAWFMLDGGGRICASKPHASRLIARPFVHESYIILFPYIAGRAHGSKGGEKQAWKHSRRTRQCGRYLQAPGTPKPTPPNDGPTKLPPGSCKGRTLLDTDGVAALVVQIAYPRMDAFCGNESPGS